VAGRNDYRTQLSKLSKPALESRARRIGVSVEGTTHQVIDRMVKAYHASLKLLGG
jgi:hypothetical protein